MGQGVHDVEASQPRPGVPKHPSADNPPRRPRSAHAPSAQGRRPTRQQALRATFARLAVENPRLASAVLAVLKLIAGANRSRAMQLVEAVSAIVLASPASAPGPEAP